MVACLVFEHIRDVDDAIAEVARVLVSGGRFLFFLNHPLLQTPNSGWIDDQILDPPEQYWRIGPYLVEDESIEEVEKGVFIPFIHRPLSRYVNALATHGLTVVRMEEPAPPAGFLARATEYAASRDDPAAALPPHGEAVRLPALPTSIRAGLAALAVGLAITGVLAGRNGWDSFIDHDAVYFHSVALDLDASDAEAGNAAYRYGRIGLPSLARGMSLGAPGMLAAAQALVTPLAFAVVVAAAVATATRVSGRWTDGLAVLLVPGLWIGFMNAWADTLLAACVLASIWGVVTAHRGLTIGAVALAALTKEVGVLAVIPATLAVAAARRWAALLERPQRCSP